MTVPPKTPWENPATPEPRRRLPRAAKTASAKKQEAEKEEAEKPTKQVATPKKTPAKDVEKPKKTIKKATTPKEINDELEKLMKAFKKVTTPKKKPALIDPDMVPLPPSTGRRAVTRENKSPKLKTTKNTPKKIGRPASTKKKTPVRGMEQEPYADYSLNWESPANPVPDLTRRNGMGPPRHDYDGPPPENPSPKPLKSTRRTPSRKTDEKKVIRKKVIKRNKKTAHFEEVHVDADEEGGSGSDDDENLISVKVGDTEVNVNLISKTQRGKAAPKDTKLDKGKEKLGKKSRGRPKKNAVVKDNDGSIPAPAPGFDFNFDNLGPAWGDGLKPMGGLGFEGFGDINPRFPPFGADGPLGADGPFGADGPLGANGPFGARGSYGLGFGPRDPAHPKISPKDPDPKLRKMMMEDDGCDCAIKNPTYPYGENGEGGPGIGYLCTCPPNGPVQVNRRKRAERAAELTLKPGQSFYRSGAGLFRDGIHPPGVLTGRELSSYCEHKLPPKPESPIIWDPTNNMQCGSCPRRPDKTPGSCHCPPEEALVFTVRAKIQIDGEDDWSPVRDGDRVEFRGHCYRCDKLVRKDDPVKGIGEPYDLNSKTYERMVDYMDGREDRAEELEAAAFNQTLGFNPDGTPKVDKDEPVIYKKWNKNGWSDKEVKRAEETRHKQWSTGGGNDEDHLTEIERRHKQWSRANDQDYDKPKMAKQPPSDGESKTYK